MNATDRRPRGATPRGRRRLGLALLVSMLGVVAAACFPPAPPAAAQLTITPTSKAFNDDSPRAGGTTEQFVVKNLGGQTSGVLQAPETSGAGEFFANIGTCGDGDGRLSPNETCEISVLFSADSGGGLAVVPSQVQISATPGGTATADLSGTEFDTTPLGVSFSDADFADGNTPGGETLTFIVNNPATVPAVGFNAALQNEAGSGDFTLDASLCGAAAPASASCLLFVTYTNDGGDASTATANLVVGATFSDVVVVPLTGLAIGTPNVLTIDAGTGNINDSFLDVTPSSLVVTFRNNGAVATGAVSVAEPDHTGEGIFAMSTDGCSGLSLAAGTSCQVTMTYKAISPTPGTATLTINGVPGGFASIVITGTPFE